MKSNPHEQGADTIAPTTKPQARWLTPGVWGIGLASFLADVGHEVPIDTHPSVFSSRSHVLKSQRTRQQFTTEFLASHV
jgi:hypothetical protein